MSLKVAVPGGLNSPSTSPPGSTVSKRPGSPDLTVIGLFGPATREKERFFQAVCSVSPEPGASDVNIRRGIAFVGDANVHIIDFPSLYEGTWVRDSDTLLHVGQCLERYTEGRLRGIVYMHGLDSTTEELRSFELFKCLVGDKGLENSIGIFQRLTHPISSDETRSDKIPSVSVLDDSAKTYLKILEQIVRNPSFSTLYQQETAQRAPLARTTAGRLLDSYLLEDENRIARARARLQGKEVEPQDPPASLATAPRARQRTSSDITRELDESKRRAKQLETECARLGELVISQGESYRDLESDYQRLEVRNQELEENVQLLESELELRALPDACDVCIQVDLTTPPPPSPARPVEPLPTLEEIATLKAEIDSLRTIVAGVTEEKTKLAEETLRFSAELAESKNEVGKLRSTNAEFEKKVGGLEKKAEGLQKRGDGLQTKCDGFEKKIKELEKEKESLMKEKGSLAKEKEGLVKEKESLIKENKAGTAAQTRLKSVEDKLKSAEDKMKSSEEDSKRIKQDLEGLRKKQDGLERERQQALRISEDILKSSESLKKELEAAKTRTDAVQKQAQVKISELRNTVDERDARLAEQQAQLKDIAAAAGTWAAASAEVERLKQTMQAEREQMGGRYQESQSKIDRLQDTLHAERNAWEAERDWGNNELQRLGQANADTQMKLKMATMMRELEVQGYTLRISELEEWGKSRWDAIGPGCIIA